MIWVYVGYDETGAVYRPIEQRDFTDALTRLSLFVGHTYHVYIQYTSAMRYEGVQCISVDDLHAPTGRSVKVGEISL
jgi:hypothetical protein